MMAWFGLAGSWYLVLMKTTLSGSGLHSDEWYLQRIDDVDFSEAVMASSGKIRVLCVDDHPLVRDGISFALQQQPDMECPGNAPPVPEAFDEFCRLGPPVTLMDLQLPDVNGTIVIAKIRQLNSKAKVIALNTYSGDVQ